MLTWMPNGITGPQCDKRLQCTPIEDLCARSRYQGQGQVITCHRNCGMLLLVPAFDICCLSSVHPKNYMRICVSEVGIMGTDKQLHPTNTVDVINCPCPWYLFLAHKSSILLSCQLALEQNIIQKDLFPWWRHEMETFPCNWPFVWGIHQSPVNSPHKGQWHGALVFSLICASTNDWVNNRDAGDLRCHCAHNDVTWMHCDAE